MLNKNIKTILTCDLHDIFLSAFLSCEDQNETEYLRKFFLEEFFDENKIEEIYNNRLSEIENDESENHDRQILSRGG